MGYSRALTPARSHPMGEGEMLPGFLDKIRDWIRAIVTRNFNERRGCFTSLVEGQSEGGRS